MNGMRRRNEEAQRKDRLPLKSIIAVVVIVGIVLGVAEMGRAEREYRAQANRQAFGAMQNALHGDEFVARAAADTIPAGDAEQKEREAEAPPSKRNEAHGD